MSEIFSITNGEIVDYKFNKGLRKRNRFQLIFECDAHHIMDSEGHWKHTIPELLNNHTAVTIDPNVQMSGDEE